jgi:linoleoyl-CoA desaturase
VRNVWAYSVIFCGHSPDQTYTFSEKDVKDETRGGWYVRQLLGLANMEGGPLFHLMAGNLSFQVEHHLYPDMASSRYAEIASRVRDICRRYGLPYKRAGCTSNWGAFTARSCASLSRVGPYMPS